MGPDEPVLLRTLRQHGYFAWWGGKNDLVAGGDTDDMSGCCDIKHRPPPGVRPTTGCEHEDDWRGPREGARYYSFLVGRTGPGGADEVRTSDWINIRGAQDFIRHRPPGRPLCLYLPLAYPHPPYGVEDPWYSMIDRTKVPGRIPAPADGGPVMLRGIRARQRLIGWTERQWAELRATYYGMCARVDHHFGMIVQALREEGIYERTAIFFLSDHGDFTGDYGLVEKNQNTFQDCLVRVPLLVKPPAGVPVRPGTRDALVELVDFSATVEALTGILPGHTHFGRSLLPLLANEHAALRDAVFCEGGRLCGERHCAEWESPLARDPGWLYWPRVSLQGGDGPEHTKATMCRTPRFKYVRRRDETDELYDLDADPMELDNRIADPKLSGVLAQLKDRMLTFYQETCDVVPQ